MESKLQLRLRRQAHDELLSRGWGTTIYEEDIAPTKLIEDLECLSLLKNGLLEPPKQIKIDKLLHVWSVDAHSKTKPDESFSNLLIGEFEGFNQWIRLGIRDGLKWTYVSKELNSNKPL